MSQRVVGLSFFTHGWAGYAPKAGALPTALHPDIQFFCMIPHRKRKSKFFVSVGGAVVKPGFAGRSSDGGFPPQATVPRTSGLSLFGEWIGHLSSQSKRATNCATPGYEVVGWPEHILPKVAWTEHQEAGPAEQRN